MLLVGMDAHLVSQDDDKIWAAYHSRDDLYKKFFLNGFDHANRLVGETWFREEDWDILAELENPTRHRFFFRANHDFQLGENGRFVEKGEEMDWFDSHKYSQDDVETMFEKSNLIATKIWQAPGSEFREFPKAAFPPSLAYTDIFVGQYLVKLRNDGDQPGDADSAVSGVN